MAARMVYFLQFLNFTKKSEKKMRIAKNSAICALLLDSNNNEIKFLR